MYIENMFGNWSMMFIKAKLVIGCCFYLRS